MTEIQPFHAYIFGTSFWYGLRGFARLTDPVRVSTWFRPPAQPLLKPTGMYRWLHFLPTIDCLEEQSMQKGKLAVQSPKTTSLTPPSSHHRPRTLHHLDRRLATHHPGSDAPHLQQRRPTPLLPNRKPKHILIGTANSSETLCQTRHHGDDLPPCHHRVWSLYALGQGHPPYKGDGYRRLWQCGVDGAGVGGAWVGDGG